MATTELEFLPGRLPGHVDPEQEADRKPINYAALAYRYRWWLACGAAIGLALGQAVYLKLGPEYDASAQVLVSRKGTVPVREEQRTLSDYGERSEHIALIMSPMMVSKAIEIGKLRELPTLRGEDKVEDVVEAILDGLKVKRSSGQDRSYMNVLTITYTSKNKEDARAIVQAMVAAYSQYLVDTRQEKSTEVLSSAQQAHDELLRKLRQKEKEYHLFRETAPFQWKTPIGATAGDGQLTTNVHQERVLAVEEQRRLNLLRQAELQSRLKAIEEAVKNGEPRDALEILVRRFLNQDGPGGGEQQQQQEISIFENRLLPMMLEEQKLTRDFGAAHPDVQMIRKSINTALEFYRQHGIRVPQDTPRGPDGRPLKSAETDFIHVYVETLRQQLAELRIRDRELVSIVDFEQEKSKEVARFQAEDQAMNAELTRLRDLWGQLVTQVNQVGIEREGVGYTLKLISPVKDELSTKRMLKFLGAGMMFGGACVAGLCVLRELRDTRLKTLADIRAVIRQPLLGTITRFSSTVDRTNPALANIHPALRYFIAPHSLEAENYRSLRTALAIAGEQTDARVIQVTSPEPGDGKTTTIANLAVAVAQSGQRVLLIDADLRRPTMHRLFRIPSEIGLTDTLNGEIDFLNAIQSSSIENLSLLPAGRPPGNPSELLSSPRLTRLLKEARHEFDVVFVDGPPLLAVSDPCVIGRQTDGVLLVLRLGKSSLSTASQARELLKTHGLKVLGTVANGMSLGTDSEYAYRDAYYREYSAAANDAASGPTTTITPTTARPETRELLGTP